MSKLFFAALVCSLVPVPALARAADVHMVGLDDDGKPVEVVVPQNEYTKRLTHLMTAARQSTAPVLKEVSARDAAGDNPWMLRTVVVGMGVSGTVGLGPIISLTATPRFRLGFTNSTDVALP